MNKENFKDMMIQLLNNEKDIYKTLSKNFKHNQPYEEMVKGIERLINHIKSDYYDNQIELYCKYFEDEITKEAEKEIEKKTKSKKKAE